VIRKTDFKFYILDAGRSVRLK